MSEFPFKFSIITAVYNVEPYLATAINSIVHQTIGFKKNVQLILVNDGSTDRSGQICAEYRTRYPNNIIVIDKDNGGVSSARNTGLAYAKGEYINFMDADDKLSLNTLEKVYRQMKLWNHKVLFAAIPVFFFDRVHGEHRLNNKFHSGTRIINLLKDYQYPQLFINSSFIDSRLKDYIHFDERLAIAEDAKVVQQLLLKTRHIGVICGTVYWYRKRPLGSGSAMQTAATSPAWYLNYMEFFSRSILAESHTLEYGVPKFIQYTVLYDLHWRYEIPELPADVLSQNELYQYQELFKAILQWIDDDIILAFDIIQIEHKLFMLKQKYGRAPYKQAISNDLHWYYEKQKIYGLSQSTIYIDECFSKGGQINLVFSVMSPYFVESDKIKLLIQADNKAYELTEAKEKQAIRSLGETIGFDIFFSITLFNVKKKNYFIDIFLQYGNAIVPVKNILLGNHKIINPSMNNWYLICENSILECSKMGLKLFSYYISVILKNEYLFLKTLYKSNFISAKKAILFRLIYHFNNLCKKATAPIFIDVTPLNTVVKTLPALPKKIYCTDISNKTMQFPNWCRVITISPQKKSFLCIYLCSKEIFFSSAHSENAFPFDRNAQFYIDILMQKKYTLLDYKYGILASNYIEAANKKIL